MKKKKSKRFFCSIVTYGVMNPDYQKYSIGRIEVFDTKMKSDNGYQFYEGHFKVPHEMIGAFRKLLDFKEFDELPRIIFDPPRGLPSYKKKRKINKK